MIDPPSLTPFLLALAWALLALGAASGRQNYAYAVEMRDMLRRIESVLGFELHEGVNIYKMSIWEEARHLLWRLEGEEP